MNFTPNKVSREATTATLPPLGGFTRPALQRARRVLVLVFDLVLASAPRRSHTPATSKGASRPHSRPHPRPRNFPTLVTSKGEPRPRPRLRHRSRFRPSKISHSLHRRESRVPVLVLVLVPVAAEGAACRHSNTPEQRLVCPPVAITPPPGPPLSRWFMYQRSVLIDPLTSIWAAAFRRVQSSRPPTF